MQCSVGGGTEWVTPGVTQVFKLVFAFRRIRCAQFKPVLSLFYELKHIWTNNQVYTCKHGVPQNIDLLCGLVMIFLYHMA